MEHTPQKEHSAFNNNTHYFISTLTIFMILGIVTHLVIKRNHLRVPANMFIIFCSIGAGVLMANVKPLRDRWYAIGMAPQHAIGAYIPIFIMSTVYNMDHLLVRRYFIQAMLVTLSSALTTPFILSAFLAFVVYKEWSYSLALLFSFISLPLEPRYIVELFQVLSNYRFLATMLQLESVMVITCFIMGQGLVADYYRGRVTIWYQFCSQIIRHLVGGALIGYLLGIVLMKLIVAMYNEPLHAVCISVLMAFLNASLTAYIAWTSQGMGLICMSAYLIMYKHKLTVEVDNSLQVFWSTLFHIVETPMLMFAMTEVTLYAVLLFEYWTMYGALFLYFVGCLERLRACLMLVPVLNRMTYNVNAKCLFILGWSGVRGTLNLYPLLTFLGWQNLSESMRSFLLSAMCYVVLSNIINCIAMRQLLQVMGLLNITNVRWANMYNCMTFLRSRQMCTLDILKGNRYLSNANWTLVRKESFVYEAYLQRAAEVRKALLFNEEHHHQWKDRVLTCPDCHKEFRDEFSAKEIEDLLNKNLLKVLKSQKVAVIKQFETGAINKKVLQILVHHLDTTIESQNKHRKETKLNINQIMPNMKVLNALLRVLKWLSRYKLPKVPQNQYRRLCFFFIHHYMYFIVLYFIVLSDALFSLWNGSHIPEFMYSYHPGIWCIFLADCILRYIGSVDQCSEDVFHNIKSRRWKIFDSTLVALGFCNLFTSSPENVFDWEVYYIPTFRTIAAVRLIGGIRLLETHAHRLTMYINYTIDNYTAMRYQLTSAWFDSIDQILLTLPQIVVERVARDYYEKSLREEHANLLHDMAQVQKTRPWIPVSVRTWQAIRMTLFAMDISLKDMTYVGDADAIESATITKALREQQSALRNMRFVQPSSIKVYFEQVPWLPKDDEEIMNFLYQHAQAVTKDTDDIIMQVKEQARGVYVVVTGLLVLSYHPPPPGSNNDVLKFDFADKLPIVDYLSTLNYSQPFDKVVTSGNTVGELGVVTGRPYDCTISCGSPSQGYWLPDSVLRTAMKMCNNPVTGMEARIWRNCCQHIAVAIMMQAPKYINTTMNEVINKLKRSFMPILRSYETFIVTVMIEDLVLINGTVIDIESGNTFAAPTLIPANAWILRLMQNMEERVEVNMLIVPREDCTPLEVMEKEEEVADLLPDAFSKELLLTKLQRKMTKWQTTRRVEE